MQPARRGLAALLGGQASRDGCHQHDGMGELIGLSWAFIMHQLSVLLWDVIFHVILGVGCKFLGLLSILVWRQVLEFLFQINFNRLKINITLYDPP